MGRVHLRLPRPVRFNNYVGLTMITAMYAADGLSLAALANAVLGSVCRE